MSQPQSELGQGLSMEWVENRRAALQRYLNRTAQHPVLSQDPDFINFLESDQVRLTINSHFQHKSN